MRSLIILAQVVLGVLLTPIVLNKGVLSVINLATQGNFNLRYQLHFAVTHFGTYVVAIVLALIFWLVGRLAARLLATARVPSVLTLLATIVLALGFAHLSQLPFVGALNTAVYAKTFLTVPPITYPLLAAVLAAFLVPGKRVA